MKDRRNGKFGMIRIESSMDGIYLLCLTSINTIKR